MGGVRTPCAPSVYAHGIVNKYIEIESFCVHLLCEIGII